MICPRNPATRLSATDSSRAELCAHPPKFRRHLGLSALESVQSPRSVHLKLFGRGFLHILDDKDDIQVYEHICTAAIA